jgi:hypothetical protein
VLFVENDRRETSQAVLSRLLDAEYRVYWHVAMLYDPRNWRGDAENVFGNTGTINVLCIPRERDQNVGGLREVAHAGEWPA